MTQNSTEHNKGVSKLLVCTTWKQQQGRSFVASTLLGFCSAMNKAVQLVEVEADRKMELNSFMVDLEADSKNASVAKQALDLCLKLVAPEYAHIPWNRHKEYLLCFEQRRVLYSVLSSIKTAGLGVPPGQQQS